MRELSLFTGGGGGLYASRLLGWTTIGYVEINEFCQRILRQRISDGIFDQAPIFGDVRKFAQSGAAEQYRGFTDVVTGGFPCQPFSIAGNRHGEYDKRNMWPSTIDIIRLVRPRFAFLENVPGLLTSGYFGTILGDLAESGYDARWRILSAAEMGAPHRRDRLWILAHTISNGCDKGRMRDRKNGQYESRTTDQYAGNVANPESDKNGRRTIQIMDEAIHGRQSQYTTIGISRENVANPDSNGQQQSEGIIGEQRRWSSDSRSDMANANSSRPSIERSNGSNEKQSCIESCSNERQWWSIEPDVGRMANGVADRSNRLIALGNGQVPAVAATAWMLLSRDLD